MKEQLKALLSLAELDNEIASLTEIRQARPKQLDPFRAQQQSRLRRVELIREELKRLRRQSDRIDQAIKACEEKITSLKIKVNQAKSNDEYQVLVEQKARVEEEVSAQEEEGLEVLNKLEELGEELKRAEEALAEAEREVQEAEADVKQELAKIDERLSVLRSERKQAEVRVDPKYLAQYNRLLERHHDRAVVAVQNGVCQGCFMSVTPQMINTLMIGKEIVACKSCQRVLYMPELLR